MDLIYSYRLAPGCCHVCRSATAGKIIDTHREDTEVIKRNVVYLCELCVTAAYKMLEPTKVLIEAVKLAALEGENTALTDEVLRLRAERDAWDARIALAIKAETVDL